MATLTLEVGGEPRTHVCADCGGVSTTTRGFVYRDGDAFAIYFTSLLTPGHAVRAGMAIGIGTWEGDLADLAAFLVVTTTADEIRFGFVDPAESPWSGSRLLPVQLSSDEARQHPRRGDLLAVAELVVSEEPTVAAWLRD